LDANQLTDFYHQLNSLSDTTIEWVLIGVLSFVVGYNENMKMLFVGRDWKKRNIQKKKLVNFTL